MKTLSKIALGSAMGAALMFAAKPGPNWRDWNLYHGMGQISCFAHDEGVVANIQTDQMNIGVVCGATPKDMVIKDNVFQSNPAFDGIRVRHRP